ncbi:MAG TPA: class I SAM-dependent DNA methyltransferase, partial [Nannocystis sp.]
MRPDDASLERKLWLAANRLRHHLDAAAYKHVVLTLVFLRAALSGRDSARESAHVPEDISPPAPDFAKPVLSDIRWSDLVAAADSPDIGARLDAALAALERTSPALAGVTLPRLADAGLDPRCLGELVALLGDGDITRAGRDVLGRVYEYFLAEFAGAEGRKGGQYYTPRGVVELLVAMLAPARGKVYDPCCGAGGMFVQSARVAADGICLYGQESNPTTWRLARMNLAIHGLSADLGEGPADTLQRDLHPDLRADVILANPPFNASAWGPPRRDDPRWRFGLPPARSANFAWVQHILYHLAPTG